MIVKILVALLFFGFMILAHEFGHYITARIFKVGINEFAIGMGPKLLSRTSKKTGIVYSWRAIPIGGFVSLVGEDEDNDREDSLNKKAWWKRFIILCAGSFMNILTAIIAMFIMLSMSPYYPSTTLANVENSVLMEYGASEYDTIVEIDGEKMTVFQDISYKIMSDGAEPLDITVERDGKEIVLENVQFKTEEVEGIVCGIIDFKVYAKEKTFGTLVKEAVFQSFSTIKIIYSSLADLITGKYGLEAVSGPVGTVNVIAETVSLGIESVLYLFVFISMNLGIFNLLPFPALDGGRLVFVIIEAIRGKPIKPEHEGIVHAIGMIILLAFMAVIVVSDIIKLI